MDDGEKEIHTGSLLDSRTGQLDDLLNEQLEHALYAESVDVHLREVAKIAAGYSAIDLAHVAARLPMEARSVVFDNLPTLDAKMTFVINTDGNTRAAVFRHLSDEKLCELIRGMPPHEAVWALDNLPDRRLRRLFELLPTSQAQTIKELAQHERHSAGRLMTNEFFAFPQEMTIEQAAQQIRRRPRTELTRRIFVINREGRVLGHLPSRSLIVTPSQTPLRQVMEPVHHTVTPDASREEVVDLVERYKIPALPVIDQGGVLVGVVSYEDVVEAMEDIADEMLAQVAGTLEDVHAHDRVIKRFFARAPWLIVTLFGGLVNAANMSYFEGLLSPWLSFAVFFVPLITGMSGNVGVQCSTVLVRGMAMGLITPGTRVQVVLKEISIGVLTGITFGILCGVIVYALNAFGIQHIGDNPLAVSVIVGTGLFGACLTATTLGVFSPLFFARVGVDPAISSGPIVTAFNDVFSMIIYFVIASSVSTFFG